MPESILPLTLAAVRFEARGKRLIHDLDLVLESGLRSIVLGPNGAGKSLLLRLCHGLIAPTAGRVLWSGLPNGAARRAQAMVFQRPILLRRSTAANVAYPLRLRGVARGERKRRVGAALNLAGLSALAERPARVLSGGEQQRLAIARAWVTRPEVLFLDEPTAHLDPAATRAVEQLIGAIHQAGTKIVMTTHDLGQARRLADEILFLHGGRLLERAPSDRFFAAPRSAEAARFLKGELVL
ncbi:MAG: ATP-binding cassette domain-containing protein [Kiloniellales bacterium]